MTDTLYAMPLIDTATANGYALACGDALAELRKLPDNSVDLIATDPPYYKVKGEAWDRAWDTPSKFLAWIGELADEWRRVLKPNGSLYVFASPKMSARVECVIGERLNVLNNITWRKHDGTDNEGGLWSRASKETLRRYFEQKECIIFAEHYGSDNIAKGEAGYAAKCDELRGFVFEPIRAYLDGERLRAGVEKQQINEAWQKWKNSPGGGMASHWFSQSQWALPTRANYEWLRETFTRLNHGGEYLRRDYEYLRRDYEDLRQEYETLRRPFAVTADVPYTDVWTFPTVGYYKGKHVCEKPLAMMRHIVAASSRPGAVVLDCFCGSGVTGEAARQLGRVFIGIDADAHWVAQAGERIAASTPDAPAPNVNTSAQVYASATPRARGGQLPLLDTLQP